jgi:hypothetical protein
MTLTSTRWRYSRMQCACGFWIEPDTTLAGTRARSYETCIYRCEKCAFGYSNARKPQDRRRIAKCPEKNVPGEVGSGLSEVLARAVNELNRPKKKAAFCSEVSEDAVTWTVFTYLARSGRLSRGVPWSGSAEDMSLLLWGVPICGPQADLAAGELATVSDRLGESTDRRSEPDAVVLSPGKVAFFEAKLGSSNDRQFDARKFTRYVNDEAFSASVEEVASFGYYELVRNWRIGLDLSERLHAEEFLLVNLGPVGLAANVQQFRGQLVETEARRAVSRRWRDLLSEDDEPWLVDYATQKNLWD